MKKNEKFAEEISSHLNNYPAARKRVEDDTLYQLCRKEGDDEGALKRILEMLYGSYKNQTEKKKNKKALERERLWWGYPKAKI
jgi:hypothetical protein